jgi:hypothetical protein
MGHPIKGSTQQDAIQEHAPVLLTHQPQILDEHPNPHSLRHPWLITLVDKDSRLGHKELNQAHEGRKPRPDVENGLVSLAGIRNGGDIHHRCQEISDGVTLLEDPREQAASLGGHVFHGHGGGQTPDATHGDAEERAHADEGSVGVCVGGADLQHGENPHVDGQRPLASPHVRGHAQQHGAQRTEEQRQRDGEGDFGQRCAVSGGQLRRDEIHRVEVVSIGRPGSSSRKMSDVI